MTPNGVERLFEPHEIIVSKTDMKGFIRYVNDAFLRVSMYEEDEVIGKPHNIIRHPDMPRCVFRKLWDTLTAGHEIFAYINNLARDGANYWVLAHVTPSYGASGQLVGYHSNRRLPDRSALDVVCPLYESLLAEERRHTRPSEAVEASKALLDLALGDREQSYDEFVWSLTSLSGLR